MKNKSLGFTAVLLVELLICSVGINVDVTQFVQHAILNIPSWYFYLIFGVDAVILASLLLIFLYRRAGLVALPLAIFAHFVLHNYYLDTFLYFDLFALFLYFALILVYCLPDWERMK